jgi:hypothetical protein
MDGALVKVVLQAIADNNPSAIRPGEAEAAVVWLRQHIKVQRNDKGGGIAYFAEVEAAARAGEQAVSLWRRGDAEAAKPLALEALEQLGG